MSPYHDNVKLFIELISKMDEAKRNEMLSKLINGMFDIYGTEERMVANAMLEKKFIKEAKANVNH